MKEMAESVILQCSEVTVDFDGFKAVQGMNFKLEKGELRFLIGRHPAAGQARLGRVTKRFTRHSAEGTEEKRQRRIPFSRQEAGACQRARTPGPRPCLWFFSAFLLCALCVLCGQSYLRRKTISIPSASGGTTTLVPLAPGSAQVNVRGSRKVTYCSFGSLSGSPFTSSTISRSAWLKNPTFTSARGSPRPSAGMTYCSTRLPAGPSVLGASPLGRVALRDVRDGLVERVAGDRQPVFGMRGVSLSFGSPVFLTRVLRLSAGLAGTAGSSSSWTAGTAFGAGPAAAASGTGPPRRPG